MRENELQILEQYDIDVKNVRKVREAVLCETNQGLFLIKEMRLSEQRLSELEWLGNYLKSQGYENVDWILRNKEGALFTVSEEENKYYLKRWFAGKECDIHKEKDVLDAVINMARIHSLLKHIDEEKDFFAGEDLRQEFERHNREMKKVRAYMRGKSGKGDFEMEYLHHFEEMYEWADGALERLKQGNYDTLFKESTRKNICIHGEYNYHNVLLTYGGIATTNFDHFQKNIQVTDFYYFLRKVMEKNHWDVALGNKMMECYHKYLPLSEDEIDYISICLAYPEKFWKAANSYHRSRKIWIPAKNIEKLELVIQQTKEKREFLETIFSFQL
jgi:CotS family spore coat protein